MLKHILDSMGFGKLPSIINALLGESKKCLLIGVKIDFFVSINYNGHWFPAGNVAFYYRKQHIREVYHVQPGNAK